MANSIDLDHSAHSSRLILLWVFNVWQDSRSFMTHFVSAFLWFYPMGMHSYCSTNALA